MQMTSNLLTKLWRSYASSPHPRWRLSEQQLVALCQTQKGKGIIGWSSLNSCMWCTVRTGTFQPVDSSGCWSTYIPTKSHPLLTSSKQPWLSRWVEKQLVFVTSVQSYSKWEVRAWFVGCFQSTALRQSGNLLSDWKRDLVIPVLEREKTAPNTTVSAQCVTQGDFLSVGHADLQHLMILHFCLEWHYHWPCCCLTGRPLSWSNTACLVPACNLFKLSFYSPQNWFFIYVSECREEPASTTSVANKGCRCGCDGGWSGGGAHGRWHTRSTQFAPHHHQVGHSGR